VSNETVAKEAVNTALMATQVEYTDLERTAVSVCQELEGEGAMSGGSVISRLRALGGRITEHARSTFRLGVLRALAVASTHYLMDLQRVSSGYVVPDDADADARQPSWTTPTQPPRSSPWCLPKSSKPTSPR